MTFFLIFCVTGILTFFVFPANLQLSYFLGKSLNSMPCQCSMPFLTKKKPLYSPGGVLRNLSDGDDRMEPKFKTQKNPKIFQRNPKKSLVKKLTPKKSHADFVAIPERDNAITQRKTLEVERSCLFIHHTN